MAANNKKMYVEFIILMSILILALILYKPKNQIVDVQYYDACFANSSNLYPTSKDYNLKFTFSFMTNNSSELTFTVYGATFTDAYFNKLYGDGNEFYLDKSISDNVVIYTNTSNNNLFVKDTTFSFNFDQIPASFTYYDSNDC